jgi:hypothetical protein
MRPARADLFSPNDRAKDAPALIKEFEAARAEVTRLYARWEELDKIGT